MTPGTCESAVIPLLEEMSGLTSGVELHIAANPEFLRAAHADHDVAHPTVSVVGSRSAQARSVLRELYAPAGGEIVEAEDATAAELIKCAHNAVNATKSASGMRCGCWGRGWEWTWMSCQAQWRRRLRRR